MMMKRIFLYIPLFTMFAIPSYAQVSRGGKPFTYDTVHFQKVNAQRSKRPDASNEVVVADLDRETEEARIEQLTGECNSCRSGGKYYGREMDMGIDFFSRAQMTPVDGGVSWTMKIVSGKSEGFQFVFNDFYLPDGCILFFHNDEKTMHLGAFTSDNNRDDGSFITQHLNGNIAHIELFVPANTEEQPRLFLDKIVYIFDNSLRRGPFSAPGDTAAYCHINTACPQGSAWGEEIKSVALILEKTVDKYYGFCTGALINKAGSYDNTANPYFLTANHCYQLFGKRNSASDPVITQEYSDPKNWVFLFRHESTNCSGNGWDVSNSLTKSATGATIAARDNNSATSDYLLLKLNNTVGDIAAYDVSFAGWDKNEDPYRTGLAGIHHPSGDIKKISVSDNTAVSDQYIDEKGFTSAPDHHWRVVWSEGITARGSSGSPLFNSYHQLIGFLTGGYSECDAPYAPDLYGKMSKAFNSGHFQNYLGQVTSVNTYSPPVPPVNYDLPLTIETDPRNVFIGNNTKVKVRSSGGTAPVNWWIWIHKAPDDFGNYNYGDANCFNWSGTSSTGNFETGNLNFTQTGTYKGTVYALDAIGRQSTNVVFSIVVTESFNPCVSAYIRQTGTTSNQLILPKGTNLSISQSCNVSTGSSSYQSECFTDRFAGAWGTYYSKYHGIAKLEWFYDNQLVATKIFNDASGANNLSWNNRPINTVQYSLSTQSFPLTEAGIHTITLKAYGGSFKMNSNSTQYEYPFTANGHPSTVSMKIQVVDCDETTLFDQLFYNGRYKPLFLPRHRRVNLKSGHITVENVTINAIDMPVNLTAYQTITLKPGTHIRNGAVFSAKIEGCPEYNGDDSNINSFSIDEDGNVSESRSKVSVYPNPTREIVNIDMNEVLPEVLFYEIYDMSGRLLARNIPQNNVEEYRFLGQSSGLFLVRIVYRDRTEEIKKVILDQ